MKSISDACWDTAFWNVGPEIRPYFVLIMQRSFRPLPLQAPGFEEISLQTFSSVSLSNPWENYLTITKLFFLYFVAENDIGLFIIQYAATN